MQHNMVLSFARITLACQAFALGLSTLRAGSKMSSYLYLSLELPETVALNADIFTGTTLLFCALILVFSESSAALVILAVATFAFSTCKFLFGGSFMYQLVFLSESVRYGFPLIIWWMLRQNFRMTRGSDPVPKFLALLIAATFIGHGIKALCHSPQFIDYLITVFNRSGIYRLSETQAGIVLDAIGAADILAGILIIVTPISCAGRTALKYMIMWGLLTAVVRFVYNPGISGLEQCLMRFGHCAAPLLLLRLWACSQAHQQANRPENLNEFMSPDHKVRITS